MIWNIISFKKQANTFDYGCRRSHTRTHSNYIDYSNNNKASIIDPLVLFAYEIQLKSSNQGHYSIPGRSRAENRTRVINKHPVSTDKNANVFKPIAVSLPHTL